MRRLALCTSGQLPGLGLRRPVKRCRNGDMSVIQWLWARAVALSDKRAVSTARDEAGPPFGASRSNNGSLIAQSVDRNVPGGLPDPISFCPDTNARLLAEALLSAQ